MTALSACIACPRLVATREASRLAEPTWHNAPVPPWGPDDAALLVVGLAPGRRGANRTGRPFCGDESGRWVYGALHRAGFATSPEPGSPLVGATLTNAVRCLPPGNRPTTVEIATCRERWLGPELLASPARVVLALGRVAFASICRLAGRSDLPFAHGAAAPVAVGGRERLLLASFHPSPLNTRTGRLDAAGFDAVFAAARAALGLAAA